MYPPQDIDLTNTDLNLLVVFDVLMRERSVARAAQLLGRTSSAVSHALARLREQFGDSLLVRRGTQMEPTPRAKAMWPAVKTVLESIRSLLRNPSDFESWRSSIVIRLAIADVHPALYARVFNGLRAAAPGMALVWRPVHEGTLEELADGELDLAMLPRPRGGRTSRCRPGTASALRCWRARGETSSGAASAWSSLNSPRLLKFWRTPT
ncbi:LysR family transcriptional regulator [Ramlibacter albus]|uniref:LysR family transcriptional regulator n=1 Tax=Ramlibacter albus TaxID=2079448 RepID=A0A923M532_9BURK|nr:LysR family transcriptional regulator [Ramlibacter albus]MBC5763078.1 LysR family transcriptional regulator [Ramlibacter albus]